MAVGRHQAHRVGLQHEQRAVQEIARVFAGDRELRLRRPSARATSRGASRRRSPPRLRQRREVVPRQRLHPRVEPIGRDLDAVLVLLDADVGVRQRPRSRKFLGRQRQRPGFVDRGSHRLRRPTSRSVASKPHLVALRLDQHVGEDRNRVLALDDALEELQFPQQIGLADDEFHACAVLDRRDRRPVARSQDPTVSERI